MWNHVELYGWKGRVLIEGYEVIIEDCSWICVVPTKQNTAVHKLRKYPGKCNTYLTNNEMIMKRAEWEK